MSTDPLRGVVVAVGSDHAGFALKALVITHLEARGAVVMDFGTDSEEPTDYPLYCQPVAQAVATGAARFGVVLGGSGQGEQIVANKVKGIRAALCYNELSAALARRHNDANVLSLGARLLGNDLALAIVDAFFGAEFEGGRHVRRLAEIAEVEEGISFVEDS